MNYDQVDLEIISPHDTTETANKLYNGTQTHNNRSDKELCIYISGIQGI